VQGGGVHEVFNVVDGVRKFQAGQGEKREEERGKETYYVFPLSSLTFPPN
jgi:hypothetical protein